MESHTHASVAILVQEATFSALGPANQDLALAGQRAVRCPDDLEAVLQAIHNFDKPVLLLEHSLLDTATPHQLVTLFDGAKRPKVIVRLEEAESGKTEKLIRLGCAGIIQGSPAPDFLHRVVTAVTRGELWVDRKSLSRVLGAFLSHHNTPKFSRREADILLLVREKLNNRQIAERLFISEDTVKWHLRNLYAKTKARDRRGLVHYAQAAATRHAR